MHANYSILLIIYTPIGKWAGEDYDQVETNLKGH